MLKSDLNVYRFVKIQYQPGYIIETHTHNFFQYFYILNGEGNLRIGGIDYDVAEGEFYLVPVGIEHAIMAKSDRGFKTIEIKFIPSNPELIRRLFRLPFQIRDIDPKVGYILKDLVHEAYKKELFFEDMINIRFAEVILYLLRKDTSETAARVWMDKEFSEMETQENKVIFDRLFKYLKDNIESAIEISELAKMAGFSEAYFCTVFKENFGMSPGQYIQKLKLNKAKEYMMYSDLNITQIACNLVFQSLHYFSRFFKKHEGVSPQKYMYKVKNNIFIELIGGIEDKYSKHI
jgi:AraC-like DNA-binding protein